MKFFVRLFYLMALSFGCKAQALTFDLNIFYYTDALAATTDSDYKRTIYDFAIMLNLNRKGSLVLGWSYASVAADDTASSTTTSYSSTEMGPRFGYYFDRNFLWSFFFTYNLQAKSDYSSGSSTAEWRGTSMKGELGYMPQWNEQFQAGVKLNYYKSTYNEQITNSTTLTSVSNGRTMIYPSLAFVYRFN
ncbi:MAG: hypothetical protein AB7N80_07300 [Bdellovibrionales bacterium]